MSSWCLAGGHWKPLPDQHHSKMTSPSLHHTMYKPLLVLMFLLGAGDDVLVLAVTDVAGDSDLRIVILLSTCLSLARELLRSLQTINTTQEGQ